MAANVNPFEEEEPTYFIEDEIKTSQPSPDESPASPDAPDISWDGIANKLLKDNFILTALELHTELVESGRELPRLRDYFSNPGNFERTKDDTPPPTLPRTSSVQTFDSLDFARYSDDGERQVDERVAVLEFELRKSQETIKSLRKTLTREAENEIVTSDRQSKNEIRRDEGEGLRPLEKKAINFLVNEYLMANDYKLTSVTFAEENEDQDFEDWDDVGLNMPKPPDVVHLFRDYGTHVSPTRETQESACQTDLADQLQEQVVQTLEETQKFLETRVTELTTELQLVQQERDVLAQQVDILKIGGPRTTSSQTPRIAAVRPHRPEPSLPPTITTPVNQSQSSSHIPEEPRPIREAHTSTPHQNKESDAADSSVTNIGETESQPTESSAEQSGVAVNDSMQSVSQSSQDLTGVREQRDSVTEERGEGEGVVRKGDAKGVKSLGDGAEKSEGGEILFRGRSSSDQSKRHMSAAFHQALQQTAFHINQENRIVSEMSRLPKSDGVETVAMLARCLPHIVPHVLLGKREELIPLILATAMLHPDSKERDRLLNILFNLIKKPDSEQRQMILTGCVVYAEHVGAERLVEELLPQCWEQISHKYVERRLLVAEACGAVASYLPPEMLSSLMLSMLQQMLMDDKDDDVREAVVRSLGLLVAFITDADKYSQAFDLLQISLRDPAEKVQRSALQVFLPSFAAWAYELSRLEHQLVNAMLRDLEDLVKGALAQQKSNNSTSLPLNETRFHLLLSVLQELLPFMYISLLETCPQSPIEPEEDLTVDLSSLPSASSRLLELPVIAGDQERLTSLVHRFENHVQQEWFEPWEQLNWLINNLIPRLLEVMMGVGVSLPRVVSALSTYVSRFCRIFGKTFTQKKVKWKFEELVDLPDDCLDSQVSLGHTAITTAVVPVYASGVLLSFNTDESRQEVSYFLKKVLCTLAFCQTSLDSLRATVLQLRTEAANHDLLLGVLWDGVVHSAAVVRATAASLFELVIQGVSDTLISQRVVPALVTLSLNLVIQGVSDTLISQRVVPALVTLANDPDMSVRIATIPSLGAIIENISIREVLDRVYMQLQSFFDDPMYREHHAVHVELIRTLARCGPNAEPKFQDEWRKAVASTV
ncbi:hypothetical protein ACOMHN_051122 [Nucella lapillus]